MLDDEQGKNTDLGLLFSREEGALPIHAFIYQDVLNEKFYSKTGRYSAWNLEIDNIESFKKWFGYNVGCFESNPACKVFLKRYRCQTQKEISPASFALETTLMNSILSKNITLAELVRFDETLKKLQNEQPQSELNTEIIKSIYEQIAVIRDPD